MIREGFTPQEIETLRLLASGLTNEAITREMGLEKGTVQNYIIAIYAKLNLIENDDYNHRAYATRIWWEEVQ